MTARAIGELANEIVAGLVKVERHEIADRESWLALRQQDVTASVVGALFGEHPYCTALELFAEKALGRQVEIDNGVLRRGRLMEATVAEAVREERGWRLCKAMEYLRSPKIRLGATPDFYAYRPDRQGRGIVQTKTVAPNVAKAWDDGAPPLWITLQALTEMMLAGAEWGAVAALVVDPWKLDLKLYEIERHEAAEARIKEAVAGFWKRVEENDPPPADYGRDGAIISAAYAREAPGKTVDLSGDNRLPELLEELAGLKSTIKGAEERVAEINNEIKAKVGDAETAILPGWRITWKEQQRRETVIPAKSIRVLRISEIKERAA